jgi:hypothetical protein
MATYVDCDPVSFDPHDPFAVDIPLSRRCRNNSVHNIGYQDNFGADATADNDWDAFGAKSDDIQQPMKPVHRLLCRLMFFIVSWSLMSLECFWSTVTLLYFRRETTP